MGVYRIREYGEPILRQKCRRVASLGSREKRVLSQMATAMYKAQGVGLAAPQIGLDEQLIVVDGVGDLIKLANPLILLKDGESIMEEGCLSLPHTMVKVKRASRVIVEGWNENEERVRIEGEDLLARVLQHEIDHLMGILIIDYVFPGEKTLHSDSLSSNKRGERNG
ncbi:peptide deformylase [Candidatus Aerophobetes bacterium]|uniref:Peptide deformylase n=1 Tax=Aerophobetes bacterium TaxID=2030807 RepID=A0A523T9U0_UNCAE|nr:MAG: peptide deformylase [Candidatus Aerophobetes bacterium]